MKDNEFFTVEQVAEILDLHPKTIRRFIQEGRIIGRKIGKQWRIAREDLNGFTGDHNTELIVAGGSYASGNSDDASNGVNGPKVQVSTVVDVYVTDTEEATRIVNTVFAIMNCKDPSYGRSRCDHIFYKNERKARFILWGEPEFIINMLSCIETIAGKGKNP